MLFRTAPPPCYLLRPAVTCCVMLRPPPPRLVQSPPRLVHDSAPRSVLPLTAAELPPPKVSLLRVALSDRMATISMAPVLAGESTMARGAGATALPRSSSGPGAAAPWADRSVATTWLL